MGRSGVGMKGEGRYRLGWGEAVLVAGLGGVGCDGAGRCGVRRGEAVWGTTSREITSL